MAEHAVLMLLAMCRVQSAPCCLHMCIALFVTCALHSCLTDAGADSLCLKQTSASLFRGTVPPSSLECMLTQYTQALTCHQALRNQKHQPNKPGPRVVRMLGDGITAMDPKVCFCFEWCVWGSESDITARNPKGPKGAHCYEVLLGRQSVQILQQLCNPCWLARNAWIGAAENSLKEQALKVESWIRVSY
eukprot:1157912-Pelagomonas_calceolata.AAC.10